MIFFGKSLFKEVSESRYCQKILQPNIGLLNRSSTKHMDGLGTHSI